jgi:hypothetical protein
VAIGLALLGLWPAYGAGETAFEVREEAYRANNRGVALLEQYRHGEAAAAFRRSLETDSTLTLAQINLAIALFNVPDLEAAQHEAEVAALKAPDAPQPQYILGLIARGQNRVADAKAAFKKVLAQDPNDVGALVNLGQVDLQERDYAAAVGLFQKAEAAEPYNATAVYNLGISLIRSGSREEGRRMMGRFQKLREAGYGTEIGQSYPEQGRYAEALTSSGAEPELVQAETPDVRYVDGTERLLAAGATSTGAAAPGRFGRSLDAASVPQALGGQVTLFDFDGDSHLDLFDVGPDGQRLYRNQGGRLTDVTQAAGLDPARGGQGAVFGDYDNDGCADLLVLREGGLSLYHNGGEGRFAEASQAGLPTGIPLAVAAAFVDADHDGDLDIFLAGLADLGTGPPAGKAPFPEGFAKARRFLLRNDGEGHFSDVTDEAGLDGGAEGHSVAVVPTDFDNRRDVDLMSVDYGGRPRLFRNLRDGTFRELASEVGLTTVGGYRCVAAADVNKDGYTDFFFGLAGRADLLALSDGRGRFQERPGPLGSSGSTRALFVDFDDDGLLDLLTLSAQGARLLRNLGDRFVDQTAEALPGMEAADLAGATLAAADLDQDGDTDLVLRLCSGELRLWENQGGNHNPSLRIRLAGHVSNRSGIGVKVETRAASLRQRLEVYSTTPPVAPGDIVLGLGRRQRADAVRVLWPAGVLQTELVSAEASGGGAQITGTTAMAMSIKELDRKPSSCPYLYAWDGERFSFVTDFMGAGEMGYWHGPGSYDLPDPDEYVRLTDRQLQERDGRLELRVTNELEEGLFVDRLALLVVTHPDDVEVHPNEGMVAEPPPFRLLAAREVRPPVSAHTGAGTDVLDRLVRMDRRFAEDFELFRIRGYAEPHTLTLDLGPVGDRPTVLLMTGWTDYAFSSDNVAAHHAGRELFPPLVQVRDAAGEWRDVGYAGIPVGRPQTVPFELTGLWQGPSREVRLTTNMRIYYDRIQVATLDPGVSIQETTLEAEAALLRERGFSREVSPDGREPYGYDYAEVAWASPWKQFPGRYTRVGDVRELVTAADDMYVISKPGDEIALSFDASRLPPLPRGFRRTYLLYADGFSKEMDINSATPDQLGPLPFHGMTRYPYGPEQSYPWTPERRAWDLRYNTRLVSEPVPSLELAWAREEELESGHPRRVLP